MSRALKLHYVCEQTFDALPGDDPLERTCPKCALQVINVASIPDAVRDDLVSIAREAGISLCASGNASRDANDAIAPCAIAHGPPPPLQPLTGAVVNPEVTAQLEQERAEREQAQARARARIEGILQGERARLRGAP